MAWDKDKAVKRLDSHAAVKSAGSCAMFVRQAILAGGVNVAHAHYAKDYGSALVASGFVQVLAPSAYQAGDIAIIQPVKGHPAGHMAMYDGQQWVSDFKQRRGLYPGEEYRRERPAFRIYRYQSK